MIWSVSFSLHLVDHPVINQLTYIYLARGSGKDEKMRLLLTELTTDIAYFTVNVYF